MHTKFTHSFALMEVSQATYDEIKQKLLDADYGHALVETDEGVALDMDGIGLVTKGKERG